MLLAIDRNYNLMLACWEPSTKSRPSFVDLVEALQRPPTTPECAPCETMSAADQPPCRRSSNFYGCSEAAHTYDRASNASSTSDFGADPETYLPLVSDALCTQAVSLDFGTALQVDPAYMTTSGSYQANSNVVPEHRMESQQLSKVDLQPRRSDIYFGERRVSSVPPLYTDVFSIALSDDGAYDTVDELVYRQLCVDRLHGNAGTANPLYRSHHASRTSRTSGVSDS